MTETAGPVKRVHILSTYQYMLIKKRRLFFSEFLFLQCCKFLKLEFEGVVIIQNQVYHTSNNTAVVLVTPLFHSLRFQVNLGRVEPNREWEWHRRCEAEGERAIAYLLRGACPTKPAQLKESPPPKETRATPCNDDNDDGYDDMVSQPLPPPSSPLPPLTLPPPLTSLPPPYPAPPHLPHTPLRAPFLHCGGARV